MDSGRGGSFLVDGDQFRLGLEAAPTGMIMINRHGRIILVNSHVEKTFGYDRSELISRSVELLVPERLREEHVEFRANFLKDPQSRVIGAGWGLYGRRKDGTELAVEIGLNPVETPEGKFVLASIADVTERKRIEEGLRESEERVRMMVSAGAGLSDLHAGSRWPRCQLELRCRALEGLPYRRDYRQTLLLFRRVEADRTRRSATRTQARDGERSVRGRQIDGNLKVETVDGTCFRLEVAVGA